MTDSNKQSHLGTKPEERFDLDVAEKEGYQRRGGDPQTMPNFDENVSRQSENVRNMGENVRTGVEQLPSKGRDGGTMAEEQPLGEELEGEAVHRTAEKSSQVRLYGDVADERGADLLRTGISGNVPSNEPSELERNQGERDRNKNLSSSSGNDENLNRRGDFSASSQQGVGNIAVDIGDQPNASSGSNMQQQQQQQQQPQQQPNVSAGARGNENLQQLGNREQQNLSGRGNIGIQQENLGGREQGGDRNRGSGQEQDLMSSDFGNLNLGSGQMQQDRQQENLQPEQRSRQVQQESRERGFDQQQQQQQQNVVEPERFGNVSLASSGGGGVSSMQEGQQLQQPQQQQQRYDTGESQQQHHRGFYERHHVDRSLQHIYDELRTVFSETESIDTKNVKLEKVTELQDRLRKIDEQYVDGKFRNDKGEIPEGQAELSEMLNSVHEKLQDLVLSTGSGVGEESEDVTSLQMR